ncbi:MAG: AbrB/MazE/SpoVT family DNA-binding domain-containing protein [Chloroflexota bacterium]|nr:AbrB/MazE/SpoVT family DNA-binding domain-containing protein [Chloroflexota bacterium]
MKRATTRVTSGGRVVIPAEYRKALGLQTGDEVTIHLEDGELRIRSIDAGIRRAQELVRHFVAPDRSLVDELIEERRAEAARE